MTLPDGPKTPRLWQQIYFITDPIGYLESNAKKYGEIFTTKLGVDGKKAIIISDPQSIEKMLSNPQKFPAPGYLNSHLKNILDKDSVLFLEGKYHQDRRKLLLPAFKESKMQIHGQIIGEITKKITSQWTAETEVSIQETMEKITMGVILQVVFGLYEGPRYTQIEELLLLATTSPLNASLNFFPLLAKDYGSWSPGYQIKRQKKQIDDLLYAEINDRRAEGESDRSDILSLLLSARDDNGEGMSDAELKDDLRTLLFAGHETTTIALSWAFYWIHYRPEVKQKLLKEIDSLGENPEPMSLSKLPYLTAVCKETLRIYPVVETTLPRLVQEPVEILGKQLEPGTRILGCIYLLHHREDLYPEPKQFKPERFLERKFSRYEYMPFGGGSRRCIGAALAEFEMKVVIGTILKQYQLELAESRPVKPQRIHMHASPSGGVKMMVKGDRNL